MVAIDCKCIHCGKKWKVFVDEHDYDRYTMTKDFPPPGSHNCGCEAMIKKDFKPLKYFNCLCVDCADIYE